MKNTIKVMVSLAALMVLAGCNFSANKMVDLGGEKSTSTANEESGQPSEDTEVDEGETMDEESEEEGGFANDTNINECLKGCDILKGGTGLFSQENCLDSCWAGEAKDTGDISICDSKVDPNNGLVQFACRLNVAEARKDPKYCEGIAADPNDLMRVGCVSNVAKLKKDPSICEIVKGSMLYGSCVEDAKN